MPSVVTKYQKLQGYFLRICGGKKKKKKKKVIIRRLSNLALKFFTH